MTVLVLDVEEKIRYLARQHDRTGAIEHSIRHVRALRTSGAWVGNHALQHLYGGGGG